MKSIDFLNTNTQTLVHTLYVRPAFHFIFCLLSCYFLLCLFIFFQPFTFVGVMNSVFLSQHLTHLSGLFDISCHIMSLLLLFIYSQHHLKLKGEL